MLALFYNYYIYSKNTTSFRQILQMVRVIVITKSQKGVVDGGQAAVR